MIESLVMIISVKTSLTDMMKKTQHYIDINQVPGQGKMNILTVTEATRMRL